MLGAVPNQLFRLPKSCPMGTARWAPWAVPRSHWLPSPKSARGLGPSPLSDVMQSDENRQQQNFGDLCRTSPTYKIALMSDHICARARAPGGPHASMPCSAAIGIRVGSFILRITNRVTR